MTNYSIRLQKSREQFGKKVKFYSNTAVKKTNYGLRARYIDIKKLSIIILNEYKWKTFC